jgi:large subunit ribosomal protein L30
MARNPAVGRQGPAFHAAVIPDEAAAPRLRVRQIRSTIGHPETMRRTLRAIGLRRYQAEIEVTNTRSIRGMLHKVRHLIDVAPAAP